MASLAHEPSDEMLIAFMASEAERGTAGVSVRECTAVFEYVVETCRSAEYRIDLRRFFKALDDYRCWKSETCETDWRVLVRSSIRRTDVHQLPQAPVTRADTKAAEDEIVRELHGRQLARDALEGEWRNRYYRRKRELRLR